MERGMRTLTTILGLTLLVGGCAMPPFKHPKEEPVFDVPPQVIYHIDDHRFISLENYRDCTFGDTYYNDSQQGIRLELGRGTFENYRGRLINADPSGRNIVIPSSRPPHYGCPDRGCNVSFYYSTDSGRTFQEGDYYIRNRQYPYEQSANYIVAAGADRIYVAKRWGTDNYRVVQYPLIPGIDLRKEYPPGIRGDSFAASRRPNYLDGLRTPSGQEYISCDDSIRPVNPPKSSK
jgi:hypothetical protein